MSTFIHNEPTSLVILQESKLPQTFLTIACHQDLPVSAEVISALPNAFGAICLNSSGLEAFTASKKPIERFLDILVTEEHIRSLQDKDVPHLVGNSVDELIRHHPSLKADIMSCIIQMLEKVVEIGNVVHEDELDVTNIHIGKAQNKSATIAVESDISSDIDKKKETRTALFIDIVSRV